MISVMNNNSPQQQQQHTYIAHTFFYHRQWKFNIQAGWKWYTLRLPLLLFLLVFFHVMPFALCFRFAFKQMHTHFVNTYTRVLRCVCVRIGIIKSLNVINNITLMFITLIVTLAFACKKNSTLRSIGSMQFVPVIRLTNIWTSQGKNRMQNSSQLCEPPVKFRLTRSKMNCCAKL